MKSPANLTRLRDPIDIVIGHGFIQRGPSECGFQYANDPMHGRLVDNRRPWAVVARRDSVFRFEDSNLRSQGFDDGQKRRVRKRPFEGPKDRAMPEIV
jgi:hypothetical protein